MQFLQVLVAAIFLAGCANTHLDSNKGPAFSDSYRVGRVLILAQMPTDERRAVEDSLVERLQKVGIDAVRSFDVMPDIPSQFDWSSIQAIQKGARAHQADSVLVLGGLSMQSQWSTAYVPMSFFGGTFMSASPTEHRKKLFTIRLYSLSDTYAVWMASAESRDDWLVSPSIFASNVAEAVVHQLTTDGILENR